MIGDGRLASSTNATFPPIEWLDWNRNTLRYLCSHYWFGEPSQHPVWEYLTPRATVVKIISTRASLTESDTAKYVIKHDRTYRTFVGDGRKCSLRETDGQVFVGYHTVQTKVATSLSIIRIISLSRGCCFAHHRDIPMGQSGLLSIYRAADYGC